MNIAITGANSAVGRTLLRHITQHEDLRATACVRHRPALSTLPVSPRISPAVIDYDDPDSLTTALSGARCVVHCAGILFEHRSSTYQTANVDATRAVAEASAAAAVRHIVFISALGADPRSPNRYLRSKGDAERLLADAGIATTIIRTPILLGPGTAGARSLLHLATRPSVRLLGGGRHTLRPLDVDDLCRAILGCCQRDHDGVTVHDLVGPTPVAYRDLILHAARLLGTQPSIRSIPLWSARLVAAVIGLVKVGGMTPTVLDVITSDEIVHRNADVDLDLSLMPLSATLKTLVDDATPQP